MESAPDNVLRFGPEAPMALHLLAGLLLFVHIAGGSLGIVAGSVAVVAPKGRRLHRAAGNVFFVAMLTMAGVAAATAPFTAVTNNFYPGAFTFYLVATAWATVRRRPGVIGRLEVCAFLAAAALALVSVLGGDAISYVFAALAGGAAFADWRMIRAGGITGPARIARHLWRMCLALFIATGSGFLGQMDEIPQALRGPHLFVLAFAPLAALLFWMWRVRLRPALRRARKAAPLAA